MRFARRARHARRRGSRERRKAAPNVNDRVAFVDVGSGTDAVQRAMDVPGGFKTAVVSWNVQTPGGSGIDVRLRARVDGRWTRWYQMGVWSADNAAGKRHSVDGQKDADGQVDTDTLKLNATADAFELPRCAVDRHSRFAARAATVRDRHVARTRWRARRSSRGGAVAELDVPERTQRIRDVARRERRRRRLVVQPDERLDGDGVLGARPPSSAMGCRRRDASPTASTIRCTTAAATGRSTSRSRPNTVLPASCASCRR